jgi:hypothetical protein
MLLAGCNEAGPARLAKQLEPAPSWLSAIEFGANGWLANRVPLAFFQRTVQEAAQNLGNIDQRIATLTGVPGDAQSAARASLGQARASVRTLGAALERGDSASVRVSAQQLKALGDALEALLQRLQGQS